MLAAVLLSLASAAAAAGQADAGLRLLWQQRRPRTVVQNASQQLAAQPDAPEPMLWLGIAWSSLGHAPDAIGAFRLSPGGDLYEQQGLAAHATALRTLGDGRAAATLRRQGLTAPLRPGAEAVVWQELVADLRIAGALFEAEDAALQALSLYPQGVVPHILLADVALDRGDLEAARGWLWLAERQGGSPRMPRLWAARMRCALLSGDADEIAEQRVAYGALRAPDSPEVALYAEVLRQQGEPLEALRLLTRSRMALSEAPEILSARVRVWADLYDWPAAALDRDRLLRAYETHPLTVATEAHYQARRRQAAASGL